jgi:hypothetical protein
MQIDFFIFERAPQALGKDVVEGAALAVQANLNPSVFVNLKSRQKMMKKRVSWISYEKERS